MTEEQKRLIDLEHEKKLRDALEQAGKYSDEKYAVKLVEKAVFALVGFIVITITGVILKVVISYINGHFHS